MIGTVKWFNDDRGFGFINQKEKIDIFVHYKSINMEGHKTLKEGEYVQFNILKTEKGLQAFDVCKIKSDTTE